MACVLAAGCGGDDPEPEAAVVWLNLGQASGGNCDRPFSFQLPAGAASTVQGQITGTPRLEDGEGGNVIDCSVRSSGGGAFQVALTLRSAEIRIFQLNGTLSLDTPGTVSVGMNSDRTGSLSDDTCTAQAEVISDGAVWIRSLSCPSMIDERSPSTSCTGSGGVLFERCQG
jgi:hypothetical protein